MPTPKIHVLFLEFFLPFPIERSNIKYFVPLLITSLKCQLHLENIDFESRTNNQHEYHLTHRNNHPGFILVFVKDYKIVKLGLLLNDLNNSIK